MEEENRCLEAYKHAVEQRPFNMSVEQGNRYLQTLQRVRDRCLAACEQGNKCNGQTKPLEGPEVFKRAGIKYRPEGYTCTLQGWVYHLTEMEAKDIQAYENNRVVNWVSPKCQDYSTAIVNGVTHHVWDRCSDKPYIIEYDTNKKKTLSKDWWKTADGRANTERHIVATEDHVTFTPDPSPDPVLDPEKEKVPWYDICGRLIGPIVGKQKACGLLDVTCHGENVTKRVTGSLGHMACWGGIALVAIILVLFGLFGRKKASETIVHVTREGATTAKHTAKAAAK